MKEPVYSGEKLDRTSGETLLCIYCARFATHRARLTSDTDFWQLRLHTFCNEHLTDAIKAEEVHMVRVLDAYRLYLGRVRKWNKFVEAGSQDAML